MQIETVPPALASLCMNSFGYDNDEKDLLPPDEIRDAVKRIILGIADKESRGKVFAWVQRQEVLQERAESVLRNLPPFTPENPPGWMGKKWMMILQAGLWSDKLASACAEGHEYIIVNACV
jgi:hypothetical protein